MSIPCPTEANIQEMRRARDWAAVEVRERVGERVCCAINVARAVRALRAGRPAYLCISDYGGTPSIWASIACDHGEEIADLWFYGEAPRDVAEWFGPRWPNKDFGALLTVRSFVSVVDPQRERAAA